MKYTAIRVAAPKLKLRRILEETAEHDGVYTRAAFLLRKLVTAHYFEDGNKRTAWVTMREYLQEHDETPAEQGKDSGKVLPTDPALRCRRDRNLARNKRNRRRPPQPLNRTKIEIHCYHRNTQ